eukprot:TRINITY_DN15875_c0_g1_i1.p1 TRINITY_DN15875_c0_g1~~TRINITY_DN15875_c0_g1_i1.p1  ORF type:complete len:174 (-),score=31.43 TRINITY_DN15875_c0_g1_i1:217-738(-)
MGLSSNLHSILNILRSGKGGEICEGIIKLSVDKPTEIRSIKISFMGVEYFNYILTKEVRNIIHEESLMLLGIGDNEVDPVFQMNPGEHCFVFKFMIKENLPSSVTLPKYYTYIKYYLKTTIKTDSIFEKESVKEIELDITSKNPEILLKKFSEKEETMLHQNFFSKKKPQQNN